MKLKNVLLTLGLALGVGGAIGANAAAMSDDASIETKATSTYYLVGTMNGWDASNTDYPVTNDGSFSVFEVPAYSDNNVFGFKIIKSLNSYDGALTWSNVTSQPNPNRFYGVDGGDINIWRDGGDQAYKCGLYGVSVDENDNVKIEIAWHYRGNDASKSNGVAWGASTDHYLINNGAAVTWTMIEGEQFKLNDWLHGWANNYEATFSGTAVDSSYKSFNGNGKSQNFYCKYAGDYVFQLSGNTLYADFPDGTEFFYEGSDASKAGTEWTAWDDADHIVKVNNGAVEFSFSSNEEFKLIRNADMAIGYTAITDEHGYFHCFGEGSNGNIKVNTSHDHYTISLTIANHAYGINVDAASKTLKTNYVLDLNGNLLNGKEQQKAYYFTVDDTSNAEIKPELPGMDLQLTEGTSNIFEITYWDKFTTLQFNNGTTWTINHVNPVDGKCLVLGWAYDDQHWTSNEWVSLDAAKYIATYLKFDVDGANELSEGSGLCKTDGWYTAAKGAYEKLSESVQKDVCSSSLALARLQAWARANEATFVVTDGVGAFSASRTVNMFAMNEVTNNGSLIAIVAITALAAAAGMFFVFRRKEQ